MIKQNRHSKLSYIFNWISGDVLSTDTAKIINSFTETENLYKSAIREISTKLEILNYEFKYSKDRNPIHEIKSRIKTPVSIYQKLVERGHDLSA
jgi:putative GTP pyrophosphokinase